MLWHAGPSPACRGTLRWRGPEEPIAFARLGWGVPLSRPATRTQSPGRGRASALGRAVDPEQRSPGSPAVPIVSSAHWRPGRYRMLCSLWRPRNPLRAGFLETFGNAQGTPCAGSLRRVLGQSAIALGSALNGVFAVRQNLNGQRPKARATIKPRRPGSRSGPQRMPCQPRATAGRRRAGASVRRCSRASRSGVILNRPGQPSFAGLQTFPRAKAWPALVAARF